MSAHRFIETSIIHYRFDLRQWYGRILGIIFLGDIDINLQMVKDGCAWHYKHFDKTQSYADAESEARAAKRGLWASGDAINPYQWRKSKR